MITNHCAARRGRELKPVIKGGGCSCFTRLMVNVQLPVGSTPAPRSQEVNISMAMSEAAREARRAYDRAYYRRNPDKQREKMRRYWEKKAAQAEQYPKVVKVTLKVVATAEFSNHKDASAEAVRDLIVTYLEDTGYDIDVSIMGVKK